MRFSFTFVVIVTVLAPIWAAAYQTPEKTAPYYSTFYYTHDNLRLEAYFFKPSGPGPYPLVLYNHGSRPGEERVEWPVLFIGRLLTSAGYAVLVPERRGYGKSEGTPFVDEIGDDRGPRFMARLEAETGDALAAVDYAKEHLPIDKKRIAIMGFSFGGIVTTLAASRSNDFVADVNQAAGALTWNKSPELQKALPAAAQKIKIPMLCMVAVNDATTESAKTICAEAKKHGASTELIVYPAFVHPRNDRKFAPGHAMFTPLGVDLWSKDVLAFLAKHLQGTPPGN